MIITTDRKSFDEALKAPDKTFLILFGQNNRTALRIHELASNPDSVEDCNAVVLIENLDLLRADEKAAWYKDDVYCTTLSRPDAGDQRKVVEQISFTTLCTPKGDVSMLKINAAFGRADAA